MRLIDYLKEYNVKPSELASESGLHEQTIYKYINGERLPRASSLARIKAATNNLVTANDFYESQLSDSEASK